MWLNQLQVSIYGWKLSNAFLSNWVGLKLSKGCSMLRASNELWNKKWNQIHTAHGRWMYFQSTLSPSFLLVSNWTYLNPSAPPRILHFFSTRLFCCCLFAIGVLRSSDAAHRSACIAIYRHRLRHTHWTIERIFEAESKKWFHIMRQTIIEYNSFRASWNRIFCFRWIFFIIHIMYYIWWHLIHNHNNNPIVCLPLLQQHRMTWLLSMRPENYFRIACVWACGTCGQCVCISVRSQHIVPMIWNTQRRILSPFSWEKEKDRLNIIYIYIHVSTQCHMISIQKKTDNWMNAGHGRYRR